MKPNRFPHSLTRRELLASTTSLAITAGTSASLAGCASVETRFDAGTDSAEANVEPAEEVEARPEAIPSLTQLMANPAAAISSGDAWVAFCDALKPLARHVTGPESLGDLQIQTEGIRCLSRLVSLGLDRFVEHADPRHPAFYDLQTPTRKYLGDNPDQTYRGVAVEGGGSYLIRGHAAEAAGVEIGVYAGSFRSDAAEAGGGRRLVDSLDEGALAIEDDGSFEILVSPDAPGMKRARNHLRLDHEANALLIRTYFWDRRLRETHSMPSIQRLDVEGPQPPVDSSTLLRSFIATAMFVDGSLDWWNHFEGTQTARNELIVMPDDGSVQTPSLVQYINGRVELEPTEVFVVEFRPDQEPDYWSFVLQNVWGETPDWRERHVVLNNREIEREVDGLVRIVVAHANPGFSNWLDMSGHPRILLSLRWRGASALPRLTTRTMTLTELASLRA